VPIPEDWIGQAKFPGTEYFSRGRIGEETYAKTMAVLSRACARLEARGLVQRYNWRELNRKGIERAIIGLGRSVHLVRGLAPYQFFGLA
jgi:hypothetical protein